MPKQDLDIEGLREMHGLNQRELADLCTEERGSRVYKHQISIWESTGVFSKASRAMLERVFARLSSAPQSSANDDSNHAAKTSSAR